MGAEERILAVLTGDGRVSIATGAIPEMTAGMVKVRVRSSLVSPGTEIGGWDGLARERGTQPAGEARPFGYSVAGVVAETGPGVTGLAVGDRVAAVGGGYALHASVVVVPQNLCVPLPQGVDFDDGSYAMLLATALHAVRRGSPRIGEYWLVVGLGIVGLLTARFLQLSGCFVVGTDEHPFRIELAARHVADRCFAGSDPAIAERLREFTRGNGLDGAVLAFGGEADATLDTVVDAMKLSPDGHPEGTIVTVGWPRFSYAGRIGGMNNIDVRRASRTGPGYHDAEWERDSVDYPPVFVRWTTRSNLELALELVRAGRIDVSALTTHRVPLAAVETEVPRLLRSPGETLGVVFVSDERS